MNDNLIYTCIRIWYFPYILMKQLWFDYHSKYLYIHYISQQALLIPSYVHAYLYRIRHSGSGSTAGDVDVYSEGGTDRNSLGRLLASKQMVDKYLQPDTSAPPPGSGLNEEQWKRYLQIVRTISSPERLEDSPRGMDNLNDPMHNIKCITFGYTYCILISCAYVCDTCIHFTILHV